MIASLVKINILSGYNVSCSTKKSIFPKDWKSDIFLLYIYKYILL